jgi:hypothetical protein
MKRFCWVVIVLLSVCGYLRAQEFPKAEVFGGYSYARAGISTSTTVNANGYAASVTGNISRLLGITVEVSQQFGKSDSTDYEFRSFNVGPRFTCRKPEKFTPFAHFLVGDARYGSRQNPDVSSLRYHENTLALAFGGGVDVNLHSIMAIRAIQADYYSTGFSRNRHGDLRLGFGVVLMLGKK